MSISNMNMNMGIHVDLLPVGSIEKLELFCYVLFIVLYFFISQWGKQKALAMLHISWMSWTFSWTFGKKHQRKAPPRLKFEMKLCLLEEMNTKWFNSILNEIPLRWRYRLFKHHRLKFVSLSKVKFWMCRRWSWHHCHPHTKVLLGYIHMEQTSGRTALDTLTRIDLRHVRDVVNNTKLALR